jgi:hypothetical protein
MRQYECFSHSLRLQLPLGWVAFEADYSVMHYRDVFLCINSVGSDSLHVEGGQRADRLSRMFGSYNAEVVADQLPVGAVYIDFAFAEGPASGPHFSGPRSDTFESAVDPLACEHSWQAWQTQRLTTHQFEFSKWGHSWSIFMYFREPVSPSNKQAAFDVIKSITFVDRPITSGMRAAAEAFDALPHSVRDSVMQRDGDCDCCDTRGIYPRWEEKGTDFQVTLVQDGFPALRRWKYLVTRGGAVTLLEEGGQE